MKIATWNVNSVRRRQGHLTAWLTRREPDVVLLQELKATEETFPRLEVEAAGYRCAVSGQKGFNGVALLWKAGLDVQVTHRALPGDPDDVQARYIEASVAGGWTVASIYLPNGNPVASEKFPYKLAWLARLRAHTKELLATERKVVLGGDYNVCPTDADLHPDYLKEEDALWRPESRAAFRAILNLGYAEAFRALNPEATDAWTFWDYQRGCWEKDRGLRIDHFLLSPQATDRLRGVEIDRIERGRSEPSDHVPVIASFDD